MMPLTVGIELINIHDINVSTRAWVSLSMPLNDLGVIPQAENLQNFFFPSQPADDFFSWPTLSFFS